jgi:hypothetical protein
MQRPGFISEKALGKSRNGMAQPVDQAKLRRVADFDYIIVGAGSAGCVLADRLSASGRDRVLVLEAGGPDDSLWIKLPVGYGRTFADPAVNWKYQTQASPGLGGRTMYWPRGRVVGGSSSMTGGRWATSAGLGATCGLISNKTSGVSMRRVRPAARARSTSRT